MLHIGLIQGRYTPMEKHAIYPLRQDGSYTNLHTFFHWISCICNKECSHTLNVSKCCSSSSCLPGGSVLRRLSLYYPAWNKTQITNSTSTDWTVQYANDKSLRDPNLNVFHLFMSGCTLEWQVFPNNKGDIPVCIVDIFRTKYSIYVTVQSGTW